MKPLRRDLLKVVGGAGVGLLATPVPWRLTGDSALWSQNWSWIPKLPRGEMTEKLTACTLCPAGCSVKARMLGANPVALIGYQGALCPAGLCGHHVAYHPARLRTAVEHGKAIKAEEVIAAAQKQIAAARGSVAVLDLRPGRTASLLYRRHLALVTNGVYITTGAPATTAYQFDKVKTVIGVSTPVLEEWGTPGRLARMRDHVKIWQAESRQSGTAMTADRWFRIRPHSEAAFLIGLMAALTGDAARLKDAAERTGLPEAEIAAAAKEIEAPALAIADGDPLLGPTSREAVRAAEAFNARFGTLVERRQAPVPSEWKELAREQTLAEVLDHSIGLLYIDDSAPGALASWSRIEAKLAPDALVVAASWTQFGLAQQARYALPVASYLETLDDVPVAPDAASAEFALSIPVSPATDKAHAADLFGKIVASDVTVAQALEQRAQAIHASKRGSIGKPGAPPAEVKGVAKPEELWSALQEGARWTDTAEAKPVKVEPVDLAFDPVAAGRPVIAYGWRGAETSPLLSKLWIESDLKAAAAVVAIHPDTARDMGLAQNGKARIESACGASEATVHIDAAVAPGVMEMSAGQAYLRLCGTHTSLAEVAAVKVVRA